MDLPIAQEDCEVNKSESSAVIKEEAHFTGCPEGCDVHLAAEFSDVISCIRLDNEQPQEMQEKANVEKGNSKSIGCYGSDRNLYGNKSNKLLEERKEEPFTDQIQVQTVVLPLDTCNKLSSQDDALHGEDHVIRMTTASGEPGDIILDTGDKHFCCHRSVLSHRSPYFEAMFASGMKESKAETIFFTNVSSKYFLLLLNYMYTCYISVNSSNVEGLLEVASEFQITDIVDECASILVNMVDIGSCLEVMRLANLYMLSDVFHSSRVFALWHFTGVVRDDSFYKSPISLVVNYLQDPYLNTDSETAVLLAAAEWYDHQDQPCDVKLPTLLASVINLTDVTVQTWKDRTDLTCHKVLSGFISSLAHPGVVAKLTKRNAISARISPKDGLILCIGAHKCNEKCQSSCEVSEKYAAPTDVLVVNPESSTVEHFASMSDLGLESLNHDSGYRVCTVGEKVYIMGGEGSLGRNGCWFTTIWRLNTLRISSELWTSVGKLRTVRRHYGMCVIRDRYILLIGGTGRFRVRLASVECFDTASSSFMEQQIPEMLHQETSPAVAVLGDKVYVFQTFAQVLDTATWTWSTLQLKPHIPVQPVFAHPMATRGAIYLTCFRSDTLWLVDLETLEVLKVAQFAFEGASGVFCEGRIFHFQLCESETQVKVASYDVRTSSLQTVGVLEGVVLTQHFVTVPKFPIFQPSSRTLL